MKMLIEHPLDSNWHNKVAWSCRYCGSGSLKCIWYTIKGQYRFKASFMCMSCGRRFTVKVPKELEDRGMKFAVVVDAKKLRQLCKYYFVDVDGKSKCSMNSKISLCEFQCRSKNNGINS